MRINSDFTQLTRNRVPSGNTLGAGAPGAGSVTTNNAGIDNASLKVLLSRFRPHGLGDIDKANLMRRVDTKYLLPISDLKQLLPLLAPSYRHNG
jgi:hypothetical protein